MVLGGPPGAHAQFRGRRAKASGGREVGSGGGRGRGTWKRLILDVSTAEQWKPVGAAGKPGTWKTQCDFWIVWLPGSSTDWAPTTSLAL